MLRDMALFDASVLIVTPNFIEALDLEELMQQAGCGPVVTTTRLTDPDGAMDLALAVIDGRILAAAGAEAELWLARKADMVVVLDGSPEHAERRGWSVLHRPFKADAILTMMLGGQETEHTLPHG